MHRARVGHCHGGSAYDSQTRGRVVDALSTGALAHSPAAPCTLRQRRRVHNAPDGLEKRRRAAPSTRKEQDTFLKHAVVQQEKLNTSPRLGSLHEVRPYTDHERKSIGHGALARGTYPAQCHDGLV